MEEGGGGFTSALTVAERGVGVEVPIMNIFQREGSRERLLCVTCKIE